MPTPTKPTKQSTQSVRISLPTDMVAAINVIAEQELLSRTVWIRRTINSAVKYSRWNLELKKQEAQWRAEKNK
jgi:metal-responsive CopG/Arc/MetJ family transcriptional regulator